MQKILLIEHHLETNIASLTKRKIAPLIRRLASLVILEEKQHLKSMVCLSQPMVWFTLQKHANDSLAGKILNMMRGGNFLLGNRGKNIQGKQWKECPWCLISGDHEPLRESHVILACRAASVVRRHTGITNFYQLHYNQGLASLEMILKQFLGQDWAETHTLLDRARSISKLRDVWFTRVKNL